MTRALVMDGRRLWIGFALMVFLTGCGITPRRFGAVDDRSPLTRARAAGMGDNLPDNVVIPALIDRLEDRDAVVRVSASESLKNRTGTDLGFVAWAEPAVREKAIQRWRAWWKQRQAALANSSRIP
jgi:HEAT repeat protein